MLFSVWFNISFIKIFTKVMIFHTQLNCFVPLNVVYLFRWGKVRRASFHFIILGALMFRGESVLLLHFLKKYESGDSNTKS